MESISDILPKEIKKTGARSEWADFVGYFQERLRDSKGRKYNYAYISMRLAHLKNDYSAIYHLQKLCEKSENFGKTFWGSLKSNK